MAVLSGHTAYSNFFGKKAKARREKRRNQRDRRREAKTKRKEAKAEIVEQKAQERGLDNQAKNVQIQATSTIASQEIAQTNQMPQQMPQNRNRNMWIIGGVVGVVLIGVLIFFMTKD